MEEITPSHAKNALQILADVALDKKQDIDKYKSDLIRADSDEEIFFTCPVFDSFYRNGAHTIFEMTNFTPPESNSIWRSIEEFAVSNWGKGKARQSAFTAKDVFFMTLTVLKHGGQWDFLGKIFLIKAPTFEKLIMRFVRILSEHVYNKFAVDLLDSYPMQRVLDVGRSFRHFKFARYATDVTFQQTNRPSGNIDEAKKYFSGKHKLYGYVPEEKATSWCTYTSEEGENKKVASDRVIVENYFGRFCSLWSVMAFKYRWAEDSYDYLFKLSIGLTNRYIQKNPLREEDTQFYRKMKNR